MCMLASREVGVGARACTARAYSWRPKEGTPELGTQVEGYRQSSTILPAPEAVCVLSLSDPGSV